MKEEFYKIIFLSSEDHLTYVREASSFQDEVDIVNILFQGFIRCVNNLKKGFLSWDEESSFLLLESMKSLAMDAIVEQQKICERWNNGEKNMLSLFIQVQIESSPHSPPHSKILLLTQMVREIKDEDGHKQISSVKYHLIYGSKGPAVMYDVSLRMMNELQIAGYVAILKNLIPRLSPAGLRVFAGLIAGAFIAVETGKFHWKKTLGMPDLIRMATVILLLNWDKEIVESGLYRDSSDFLHRMVAALPEFE